MIIFVLVVLGLILGSFVNALVWRVREQSRSITRRKKNIESSKDLSIVHGRSMCPNCHHTLAAKDLLPVLSWLELRGKCRYCQKAISWQYPLVEVLTSLLFVVSYIWWPLEFNAMGTINFIVWLIVLTGFMTLFVYDLKWLLLPNRIVYPLVVVSGVMALINILVFDGGLHMAGDVAISLLIASGIFYGLFQVSKGKWIGGGDVKLGLIIGFVIGVPLQAFLVLFTASLIGTMTVLPGLVSKKIKATSRIPFGPYLIVGTIIIKIFGASIVHWYRTRFLLY